MIRSLLCAALVVLVTVEASPMPNFGGIGLGPGAGLGLAGPVSDTCRYWCKTDLGQAYCCESGLEAPGIVAAKPGYCPPVRPTCPRFRAPQLCSNDGACKGVDKCCFDKCLGEHVCKPPLF
ncbi:hypothetical protein HAZT_HAZT004123 [Hyalella azteca]|uniref:Perlwapin-like n=1 Tax=Hyalella azteca TaxID=294128 RepID=A0A6A0H5R7_HYAAZ|nr:perlwapin-like [Hyalella azteca]KAA0200682.1 hypothetical protein HAZT_HAZT004123 [Hyalella azteca]